jgi:aerobic-type carbon monoxide dehydrogenase small subunit (CoxS/CutS family)
MADADNQAIIDRDRSTLLMEKTITLTVNGRERTVTTDPARPLLEVLREDLGLTGTKYGCGEGQCGACTVLIGDRAAHACVVSVGRAAGQSIQTIEGLADGEKLHPVQEAFLSEGASQCGYCTPGMIMGTVALLAEQPQPSAEEIIAQMDGHICRCNNYVKILAAIHKAAEITRRASS